MWARCGVVRDRDGLLAARTALDRLSEQVAAVRAPGPAAANYTWQEALDLVNQVTVAQLVVESALAREESRGAHYRSDFPERRDDAWLRYVIVRRVSDGRPDLSTRPVEATRLVPEPEETAP
jgi:succinate dehydrogenase/fumarate reductase flavoprotein subunit